MANIKCISWRNMKVCVCEHKHMDCFFIPISHSATRLACELVLFRLCSLCTSLNLWMSLIFLFLSKNHLSPVLYLCIFPPPPPHQTEPNVLFFLSVCQLEEKGKKKPEEKQINAGLCSETQLGLAGHHLSSVFHNHSRSLEQSMVFFNCPSAGKRV